MAETPRADVELVGGKVGSSGLVVCASLVASSALDLSRAAMGSCERVLGEVGRLGGSSSLAAAWVGVFKVVLCLEGSYRGSECVSASRGLQIRCCLSLSHSCVRGAT